MVSKLLSQKNHKPIREQIVQAKSGSIDSWKDPTLQNDSFTNQTLLFLI